MAVVVTEPPEARRKYRISLSRSLCERRLLAQLTFLLPVPLAVPPSSSGGTKVTSATCAFLLPAPRFLNGVARSRRDGFLRTRRTSVCSLWSGSVVRLWLGA